MAKKKIRSSTTASHKKTVRKPGRAPATRAAKTKGKSSGAAGPGSKARAVALLEWVHGMTDRLIDSIPAEQAMYQAVRGDNHLMWNIGHLAATYSWAATLIDTKAAPLPESYGTLFGYGSKPVDERSAYPALEEVKKAYRAAYQRFTQAVAGQSEKDLAKATAIDAGGFASDRLDVVYKVVWHEGWHSGQISALRRALGLPSIM